MSVDGGCRVVVIVVVVVVVVERGCQRSLGGEGGAGYAAVVPTRSWQPSRAVSLL